MKREVIITGDEDAQVWEDRPDRRDAAGGWGMCNTGSGKRLVCCFGGIGCDVDHVAIMLTRMPLRPR